MRVTTWVFLVCVALGSSGGRASAQDHVTSDELGSVGPVVWSTLVEESLSPNQAEQQQHVVPLPAEYPTAGSRVEFDYELERTRHDYPYWAAAVRIDALSADGQSLGRIQQETVHDVARSGVFR